MFVISIKMYHNFRLFHIIRILQDNFILHVMRRILIISTNILFITYTIFMIDMCIIEHIHLFTHSKKTWKHMHALQ